MCGLIWVIEKCLFILWLQIELIRWHLRDHKTYQILCGPHPYCQFEKRNLIWHGKGFICHFVTASWRVTRLWQLWRLQSVTAWQSPVMWAWVTTPLARLWRRDWGHHFPDYAVSAECGPRSPHQSVPTFCLHCPLTPSHSSRSLPPDLVTPLSSLWSLHMANTLASILSKTYNINF